MVIHGGCHRAGPQLARTRDRLARQSVDERALARPRAAGEHDREGQLLLAQELRGDPLGSVVHRLAPLRADDKRLRMVDRRRQPGERVAEMILRGIHERHHSRKASQASGRR
jgi:hypothetical protein